MPLLRRLAHGWAIAEQSRLIGDAYQVGAPGGSAAGSPATLTVRHPGLDRYLRAVSHLE